MATETPSGDNNDENEDSPTVLETLRFAATRPRILLAGLMFSASIAIPIITVYAVLGIPVTLIVTIGYIAMTTWLISIQAKPEHFKPTVAAFVVVPMAFTLIGIAAYEITY